MAEKSALKLNLGPTG